MVSLRYPPSSRILPLQHSNRAPGNCGRDSLLAEAATGAAVVRRTSSSLPAGKSLARCNVRSEFPRNELLRSGRRIGSASSGRHRERERISAAMNASLPQWSRQKCWQRRMMPGPVHRNWGCCWPTARMLVLAPRPVLTLPARCRWAKSSSTISLRGRWLPRGGNAGDARSEAELLQAGRVQFAAGVEAVCGLEFLHCGNCVGIPFPVGLALVVSAAREG